jgi:hypothetical protein
MRHVMTNLMIAAAFVVVAGTASAQMKAGFPSVFHGPRKTLPLGSNCSGPAAIGCRPSLPQNCTKCLVKPTRKTKSTKVANPKPGGSTVPVRPEPTPAQGCLDGPRGSGAPDCTVPPGR